MPYDTPLEGIPHEERNDGNGNSGRASVKRWALLLIALSWAPLYAQEDPAVLEPAVPAVTREQEILDMDIRTSSLSELAAWCRSLGLGEGGTREDMQARLRSRFGIEAPIGGAEGGRRVTILSARRSEFFTLDTVGEDYARLEGDVVITLEEDGVSHRIAAREILFNRTRNLITAEGDVEYVRTEGDTVETSKGELITVDLDNWSTLFMDGQSDRSMNGKQTAYRFAGEVISRTEDEVTVLRQARITNAVAEPYWSMDAYRVWLLPDSNAILLFPTLKVGEVPVFWFPLIWLPNLFGPADEIVFHPVPGFRSREGAFIQTTTYFLGRSAA
jgi:lipopolysaccharide assembly outer membrane protein LptD (OstA)